jgi:RimJ/RimL family protein N-acetyltransferase
MLLIADRISKLSFSGLMQVYAESNALNAEDQECSILDIEQGFYDYLRGSFFAQENSFYAVWLEAGEYVSALRMEPFKDGFLLAALETAPQHRRKGYAGKLIEAVLALDNFTGKPIYSHIHKKNRASQAVHAACGFVKIMDRALYLDGSANSYCDTWKLERE